MNSKNSKILANGSSKVRHWNKSEQGAEFQSRTTDVIIAACQENVELQKSDKVQPALSTRRM